MVFIFASVTLLALLNNVQSHPSGPPHSACVDMMPRHDVEPQGRVSPYSVQVNKSKLQSGDSIEVTIQGATDDDKILGFMVQAQAEGKVVGKWIVSDTNVYGKSMHCFGADDTLGHRKIEGAGPTSVSFIWEAPTYEQNETKLVKFNATIALSRDTFWVGVVSDNVSIN